MKQLVAALNRLSQGELPATGRSKWWWIPVLSILAIAGGATLLSFRQHHAVSLLTTEHGTLQQVRLDLAQGYRQIMMAGARAAASGQKQGMALVERAGEDLDAFVARCEQYGIGGITESRKKAVQSSLAAFRQALAPPAGPPEAAPAEAALTARLDTVQIAFDAVDSALIALDDQIKQEVVRTERRHQWQYVGFLCGAGVLLAISFALIHGIGRARRGAVEALNSAQDYIVNVVNTIGDPVFVKDEQHRMVLVNDAECALTGCSREELIGKSDPDFFPPEQAAVFWEMDDWVLKTGNDNVNEETITDAGTGELRTIVTRKTLYVDPSGRRFIVGVIRDITERKRMEEALRSSILRYRSLFENMIEGFAYCRMEYDAENRPVDFVYLDVNSAFSRLTGLGNVLNRRVTEVIPGIREANPELFEIYGRVALSGTPERFEINFTPLSRWLSVSVYSTEKGRFVAVFDDITERKRSEQERETTVRILELLNISSDSRELMKAIISYLKEWTGCEAVGVRLHDGDDYPYFEVSGFPESFVRLESSLCARDLNGQVLRDERGNPILDCMCGNILCGRFDPSQPFFSPRGSFWSNCTTELLASSTEEDRQSRTRNRCNGEGYESVALIPLRSESTVFGLIQLNDRRKGLFSPARIELLERLADSIARALAEKLAREALRESEERFNQIAEQSREIIWELDATGLFTYVSRMSEHLLGYRPEELVGKVRFFELYPEEGREEHLSKLRAIAREKAPFHDIVSPTRAKDGHIVWISSSGMPVLDECGQLLGYRGSDADITARRWAEEERERLEGQLRQAQKMEAVGQLAGGIAHDFNNLLQVILGHLDLLQGELDAGDATAAHLDEVRVAAERAAELVQQLLAFSRRQVIQPVNLDLNDLVRGVLKMIRRVIGEHIELYFIPGERLGTVCVDRVRIEQVLMNLCVNARDAMPEGGTLTIETENVLVGEDYCREHPWATMGRYALMSVTDTGHGMDESTRAQIFEPFFTTKEVGQGTGLGLATVYGIVKQHSGLIHVYSEPGLGSTFKIYIPLVERLAEAVGSKTEGRAVGGTETILVAEDEEMVRGLVVQMLRRAGYTVLTACDGEEALRVFEEHAGMISLALLDVMMPKIGGREVMARIQERNPRVRILFSSGYSENAVHTNFVVKEGLNLISKPYRRQELLRTVRKVLDEQGGDSPHASGAAGET